MPSQIYLQNIKEVVKSISFWLSIYLGQGLSLSNPKVNQAFNTN